MAFSDLNPLSQTAYQALQGAENYHPIVLPNGDPSKTGSPDPNVSIVLSGWVGDDVLLFTVSNSDNPGTTVSLNTVVAETIDVSVKGVSRGAVTLYYSVKTGSDNRTSDWTITYDIDSTGKPKGKWVFTKGKTIDPKPTK